MVPSEPVAWVDNSVACAQQRSVIGRQALQLVVRAWVPGQAGEICGEYNADRVVGDLG